MKTSGYANTQNLRSYHIFPHNTSLFDQFLSVDTLPAYCTDNIHILGCFALPQGMFSNDKDRG